MLRLLIKDITVEKHRDAREAVLHVRWQGGTDSDIVIELPAPIAERTRYPSETVERVRGLARTMDDEAIAAEFNEQGLRSATGKAFSASMISWIRFRHRIPRPELLKATDELTVNEVMARFGVSRNVVYYWIERGVVEARKCKPGERYQIKLTPAKEAELETWVEGSSRIETTA